MPQNQLWQGRLATMDAGSGEPVLLLHSSASSNRQWRGLTQTLFASHRVIAPDLPGYGRSPAWPADAPVSLGHHAALACNALPSGSGPVHVVGHSFGGAVALRFAQDFPHLVRSLTLYEPVAFWTLNAALTVERRLHNKIARVAEELRRTQAQGRPVYGIANFIDFWGGPNSWNRLPGGVRSELVSRAGTIIADFDAIDAEERGLMPVRAVAAPALLLYGARSPEITVHIARRLATILPNATTRKIDDAGHMGPITHSHTVNPIIVKHIARNYAPANVVPFSDVLNARRAGNRKRPMFRQPVDKTPPSSKSA